MSFVAPFLLYKNETYYAKLEQIKKVKKNKS